MIVDLDLADLLEPFEPSPVVSTLHAKQTSSYYNPARFKCELWGRRTGKSRLAAVSLLGGRPGDVSLYFARTIKSAKAIMLPAFRELNFQYDLGLRFNMSDYQIIEPNGAVIQLAGVKDEAAAENLRGPKYRKVRGDECGAFHSELLQYAVQDVLQPTLVDTGGDMSLSGTPGPEPDPEDFWFQLTGDPSSNIAGRWPTSYATIYDNTKIPVDPRIAIADILRDNRWTTEHPTFRREYLAQWVPDVGSLVFDWQGDYETGPDSGLTVLALDFGATRDHTSFTVLRQPRDTRPHVWVMQSYSLPMLDIGQIAEQVAGLRFRWKPHHIIGDGGGLGAGYILSLNRQYNIPIEKAEKQHLRARIDMGRGMLSAGLLHLCHESRELHNEWKRLPWNALKTGFHDKYQCDATDGALYGLQLIQALEPFKPPVDNRTEAQRISDMRRANAMRAANQQARERRMG